MTKILVKPPDSACRREFQVRKIKTLKKTVLFLKGIGFALCVGMNIMICVYMLQTIILRYSFKFNTEDVLFVQKM